MSLDKQEKDLLLKLLNKLLNEEEEAKPKKTRAKAKPQEPKEEVSEQESEDKLKIETREKSSSKEAKFTKNRFVDDLSMFKNDLDFNKKVDFKVSKRSRRDGGLREIVCKRCDKKFMGLPSEFICNKCAVSGRSRRSEEE